jgi:hypothetical protein
VEKEGDGGGELSGEVRRLSGWCNIAAGAPPWCRPVVVRAVAAGPLVELGLGFFGWRLQRALVTLPPIEAWGGGRDLVTVDSALVRQFSGRGASHP